VLFAAAAWGGAHGGGRYAAWGRRAAWQSMSGLMGIAWSEIARMSAFAERCSWWRFESEAPWFHNVAWDVGLMCVRPDGAALAAVAATDTD